MRNARYESPHKQQKVSESLKNAESRIKMRQDILEELEREKREKQHDIATSYSEFKEDGQNDTKEENKENPSAS
jgi:hypothetical protein